MNPTLLPFMNAFVALALVPVPLLYLCMAWSHLSLKPGPVSWTAIPRCCACSMVAVLASLFLRVVSRLFLGLFLGLFSVLCLGLVIALRSFFLTASASPAAVSSYVH